jgi:YtfJ family uncharacterized protein
MVRLGLSLALSILFSTAALAELPSMNNPLPALSIVDKGELVFEGKEFGYRPWHYQSLLGEVHILQYFAGTQSASDSFKPLTDLLSTTFPDGGYHVTTVINLDAAMWGTAGMVTNKAKSSKKEFPLATLVLDEDSEGQKAWQLAEKGGFIVVMDKTGDVIYITHSMMSESDVATTLALIESALNS